MDKFGKKMDDFLRGRHGADQLSFTMSIVGLVLVFCSPVFSEVVSQLLSLVGFALIVWAVFRALSRNEEARNKENAAFIGFFKHTGDPQKAEKRRIEKEKKRRMKEKLKTHELFYCPKCHASCFVPKGKGKVRITCPKCGEKFIGKT